MRDSDTRSTALRAGVEVLYRRLGITPPPSSATFTCPALSRCSAGAGPSRPFRPGTWPYVGSDYGQARVFGLPTRIVFVAMERGGTYNPLDEPRFYDTQRNFRCALLKRTNAHMGGVATILSRLVDDKAPEVHAHQYALTNAVKCVWSTGTMNSTSTPEMARNCASHLRAELDLLQPHLIVTQGGHPRHTLLGLLPELSEVAVFVGPRRKAQVFSSRRVVVLATPHPARCPGFRYKADVLPVFLEAAVARTRDEVKSLQREAAG